MFPVSFDSQRVPTENRKLTERRWKSGLHTIKRNISLLMTPPFCQRQEYWAQPLTSVIWIYYFVCVDLLHLHLCIWLWFKASLSAFKSALPFKLQKRHLTFSLVCVQTRLEPVIEETVEQELKKSSKRTLPADCGDSIAKSKRGSVSVCSSLLF